MVAREDEKATPIAMRLAFLREPKYQKTAGALSFGLLGWLSWYSSKFAMARAGAAANATGQAISEVATFFNTLCSCGLLPLTSLLTAANQAKDPSRLLGLIGTGLMVALVVGLLGEIVLLWAAPVVLLVFESQQPLLPEAAFLSRVFNAAFAVQVIDGALVGVLFGLDEHFHVLSCLLPLMAVSLAMTCAFLFLLEDLAILMVAQPLNCVLFMVLLGAKLRTIVLRLHAEKHAETPPQSGEALPGKEAAAAAKGEEAPRSGLPPANGPPPSPLRDLMPSDQVWRDLLSATSGHSVRNLALSLKTFLCVVFATRLGNVAGSAFSLQTTIGRHLAGPAGFIGLGATMAAPRLLEKNNLSFFLVLLRAVRNLIIVSSAVWFYVAAWSGPSGVLAWVGIDDSQGLVGTQEEYLQVLAPHIHWLWAAATVLNEAAAPYDGMLLSLKLYSFLGAIYAGNLFLVLLPGLYLTQRSVRPGSESCDSRVFSGYSGIMLVLFLWSAARLVACVWGVYWLEVPRRMAILKSLEVGCSRDILVAWLRNRCDCPEEEFLRERALIMEKPSGEEREAFRRRETGPFAAFARQHKTSVKAIESLGQRLYAEGDKELQELVHKAIMRECS